MILAPDIDLLTYLLTYLGHNTLFAIVGLNPSGNF